MFTEKYLQFIEFISNNAKKGRFLLKTTLSLSNTKLRCEDL